MSEEPLVTVLTPVYNGEAFLEECIESVLRQTYRNYEYIIVNNCSKDRTPEIASQYAKRDSRIRVHNNNDFVGVIENLVGTYVSFIGTELKLTVALALILIVLVVRPSGLFGRVAVHRV